MRKVWWPLLSLLLGLSISGSTNAQGDVRSATGMPIPIGAPVIWGQVELRGLAPNEPRPTVVVRLMFNGAQVGTSQANDRGYYYFVQAARDGSELAVVVGGNEVGRQVISSLGGERYDMTIDWSVGSRSAGKSGVVSLRDAYSSRSESNKKLFARASDAARAKKTDEAIKLFRELLAADSADFVAWTELGSLYFGQSKLPDAEQAYLKAIELKPDFFIALLNAGKLYMANRDYPKAVLVLENAVAKEPTSADALQYLGETYLQVKQGSKAVVVLNEAIRLAPIEKADIHLRLATLYNAAGLKDRAAAEYKQFLQKKPDYQDKAKLERYIKDNSPPTSN